MKMLSTPARADSEDMARLTATVMAKVAERMEEAAARPQHSTEVREKAEKLADAMLPPTPDDPEQPERSEEWRAKYDQRIARAAKVASAEELRQLLSECLDDELTDYWPALVRDDIGPELERFAVEYVAGRLPSVGKRALNARLKDVREEAASAARVAAQEAARGSRFRYVWDQASVANFADTIEAHLVRSRRADEIFVYAGSLSRVVLEPLAGTHAAGDPKTEPPPQWIIAPHTEPSLRRLIEAETVFTATTAKDAPAIAVPPLLLQQMLRDDFHDSAPEVGGLCRHPLVTADGRIIAKNGIDPGTKLLFVNCRGDAPRPLNRDEARDAANRIFEGLFAEFPFKRHDLDRAAALAFLLNTLLRKAMDITPAFHIGATQQSSGKTTLARVVHVIATGADLPVISLPADEAETGKIIFALLRQSPEMIVIDNIPDGFTFRSHTINTILTRSTYTNRVLGESRSLVVPTNTTIAITGNNVSRGRDEASRYLETALDPRGPLPPEERTFVHADVLAYARSVRDEVLRDALGIVAGYLKYGESMPTRTRFPAWDRMVRAPILWATDIDLADIFAEQRATNSDVIAERLLLATLHDMFPDLREFGAAEVVRRIEAATTNPIDSPEAGRAARLEEALNGLRTRDTRNVQSVGHGLKKAVGKPLQVGGGGGPFLELEKVIRDNQNLYRIVSSEPPGGDASATSP